MLVVSCVDDRSAQTGGAARATGPDVTWYRTLFGQSALGMTVADGQRRVIDCNDAFCRILGRSREEVLGRRFSEFNVPGDADVGGPALEAVIAGAPAFSYEKRYLRADGTATWVRINLAVLSREDDRYAGIIEDIDERKQAEAERELALAQLRETTDLLARAHEVAKLGTFAIDSRSRTMLVSAELAKMLAAGQEPFELSVDAYRETFVHPDDRERTMRLAETAFCGGDPPRWERRLVRRDGEVIWETSHMLFELDEQGRAARVMGVVQDITDRVPARRGSPRVTARASSTPERVNGCGLSAISTTAPRTRLVAQSSLKLARAREEAGADATRLDDISDHLREAIEEIRALAHGICPRAARRRPRRRPTLSRRARRPSPRAYSLRTPDAIQRRSRKRSTSARAKRSRTRQNTAAPTRRSRSRSIASNAPWSWRSPTTAPDSTRANNPTDTDSRACAIASRPSAGTQDHHRTGPRHTHPRNRPHGAHLTALPLPSGSRTRTANMSNIRRFGNRARLYAGVSDVYEAWLPAASHRQSGARAFEGLA